MAWSVQDLADVTQVLITNLSDAIKASPRYVQSAFPFEVSGLMPAVSRNDGTNVLTLYLLHAGRDPYWRNTPVQGQRGQPNTSQPLSLNLSYLLTSYSEKNWQMEQYLMSVALSWFHANPVYISPTAGAEFTVALEADSIEEMSRLWQAIAAPIRLSAMFRVAIVFLAPEKVQAADVRPPAEVSLSLGADLGAPAPSPEPEPRLFELAPQTAFRAAPAGAGAAQITALPGQAGAAAGQSIRVRGSGLDGPDAAIVYLTTSPGGASEWPLTGWRVSETSGPATSQDELLLILPGSYAALPPAGTALTSTPPPGTYWFAVRNAAGTLRSNPLTLSVAPAVQGIGPEAPILLPDASHRYSFSALGLAAGATSVLLGQTTLTIAAALSAGAATVDAATGDIAFMLPAAGPTSGSLVPVRVIVNGVEAAPGWWVKVP